MNLKRLSCPLSLLLFCLFLPLGLPVAHAQITTEAESIKPTVAAASATAIDTIDLSTSKPESARVWQMTGPFGGDVTALVIDPRDPDRVLIGTNDAHIFRSTDGGQIWKRLKPGIKAPGLAITVLLFDRERPNVVYAGMKQVKDIVDDATGGGVFVSEDGGVNWREIEILRGRSVRSLVQSPGDANVLVIAARDGVYRSPDRGATWKRITPEKDKELTGFHSVAIDPRDTNTIYVGTWHLPWKTTDGGETWKLAGLKDTGMVDDSDIFMIHIDEKNPNLLWMSACSGIYRSTDASANWTKIKGIPYASRRTHVIYEHPTKPEHVFAGTTEGLWFSNDGGKEKSWQRKTGLRVIINAIAVHPDKPERVFVGTEDYGVLISNDGGDSYEPSNAGFISRQIRTVLADRTERGRIYAGVIFDGANGGLFVSEDGGVTWQQSMQGMGVRDVYSLYQSAENPATIYAGTNHGLVRSDDHGRTWRAVRRVEVESEDLLASAVNRAEWPIRLPEVPMLSLIIQWPIKLPEETLPQRDMTATATRPRTVEAAAPSEPEVKPTARPTPPPRASGKQRVVARNVKPAPRSKKPAKPAPPPPSEWIDLQNQVFAVVPFVPSNNDGPTDKTALWLLASTWNGLFRSEDEKKGWKEVKLPAEALAAGAAPNSRAQINALATSVYAPGLILLGTENGLFASRDNGASFSAIPLKTMDGEARRIRAITFDPRTAETVYVGTTTGFFRSLDGGQTWEQRGGGMPMFVDVSALVVNPVNPDELYLGDYLMGGFYHSLDRGRNWEPLNISELPSLRLWTLTSDPFDRNRVYAGSFSGGVYVMSRR